MQANIALAESVTERLIELGVKNVVMCAGSFNSPFIATFQNCPGIKIFNHFEERGAAFFALGLSKSNKQPVVVCVTSGTAVAECLPAIIEAYYEETQLVVLSADREEKLSATGYPQAIEQTKLLSTHTALCLDVSRSEELSKLCLSGPSHINVRFSEPILTADFKVKTISTKVSEPSRRIRTKTDQLSGLLKLSKRPIVLVENIEATLRPQLKNFLLNLGAPVIAEARSGLREDADLHKLVIKAKQPRDFDCALRIGSVPTSDLWRSLERDSSLNRVPVISLSPNGKFPGLSRATTCLKLEDEVFEKYPYNLDQQWAESTLENDSELYQKNLELFKKYPLSEPALISSLSIQIQDFLYLGNSLAIREWNQFASYEPKELLVQANRGANGIDGQIASFLGSAIAANKKSNWAIMGDLTFLYDCNSLTLASNLESFRLIIINNNGGRIFERLPYFENLANNKSHKDNFLNAHKTNCSAIAEAFGVPALRLFDVQLPNELPKRCVIEIVVDLEQTENFCRCINN